MSDLTVICRKQFIQAQKNKSPFFSNTVSIQNSVNQDEIIGSKNVMSTKILPCVGVDGEKVPCFSILPHCQYRINHNALYLYNILMISRVNTSKVLHLIRTIGASCSFFIVKVSPETPICVSESLD